MSEVTKSPDVSRQEVQPEVLPSQSTVTTKPQASNNYAGFWIRFAAYLTDILIISLISWPLSIPFNMFFAASKTPNFMGSVISIVITAGYFVFFWTREGQTLGMRLVAIKVQKEDGQKLDIGTGIVRYIGMIISSLSFCLGFIWVGFDKRKQGWHDKIAKTEVVHTGEKGHKKIATFIVVMWFVAIILGIIALIAFMGLLISNPTFFSKTGSESIFQTKAAVTTQEEADDFAHTTFAEINNLRKARGVPQLKEDLLFCSYAQRRLEQLTALGRLDDEKGLNEDWADSQMQTAYFNNYAEVKENSYKLDKYTSVDSILHFWGKDKNDPNYGIVYSKYTQGCVRATPQFIYFIDGQLK